MAHPVSRAPAPDCEGLTQGAQRRDCGPCAPPPRIPPAAFQAAFVLGNLAFLGAWVLALSRPAGWQWMGPVLLALFLVLRVGGMWTLQPARRQTRTRSPASAPCSTPSSRSRPRGFWVFTVLRGPQAL